MRRKVNSFSIKKRKKKKGHTNGVWRKKEHRVGSWSMCIKRMKNMNNFNQVNKNHLIMNKINPKIS